MGRFGWRRFNAAVRGRVGEKAIQRIGLSAPSNDANTGDIVQPLQSFAQMRDGLKDIQAQVGVKTYGTDFFLGGEGAGGSNGVQSVQRGTFLQQRRTRARVMTNRSVKGELSIFCFCFVVF